VAVKVDVLSQQLALQAPPPGLTVDGAAARISDAGAPATKATFTLATNPLASPVTVAVPAVVVLVNVTVAMPLALVTAVGALKVPSVVAKDTVTPDMGFPHEFVTVARIAVVLEPLATMEDAPDVTVTLPTTTAEELTVIST
jgi:hypothetical protein